MTAQIRMNAIMRWRNGKIFGMMIMKVGIIMISDIVAMAEPRRVSLRAWWPCPARRSSCPGRVPSPVSSSGAPRKIAGMKSRKVWVIAIAVMNIISVIGWSCEMNAREKIKMATRLMWMPGVSPVMVPDIMPRRRGIRGSMLFCLRLFVLCFCMCRVVLGI